MRSLNPVVALLFALAACGSPGSPTQGDPDASFRPDAASDLDAAVDDEIMGVINISSSLPEVLQTAVAKKACDDLQAGLSSSRSTKALCGKWIFFYETFDTAGLPLELLGWMFEKMPTVFGDSMDTYGMFPNPDSQDDLPVGLARGPNPDGGSDVAAFTCGSCHFGRAQDGRYVVGLANLDYDYGRQFVEFMAIPAMLMDPDTDAVIPPVKASLAEPIAAARADVLGLLELLPIVSSLGQGGAPSITHEIQNQYFSWKPGTMDFLIEPIIDDGVETVSRILSLWSIPSLAEAQELGMAHQMLSWTGFTASLHEFIGGFAVLSEGSEVPEWKIEALEIFLSTLEAPSAPAPLDSDALSRGQALFASADCNSCHDGPSLESTVTYPFEEIGTDDAMRLIFNPAEDGTLCCGFEAGSKASFEIKSPRLTGLWTYNKFLHNGSVDSLEGLFCLDGPRPTNTDAVFSDRGHDYTCDMSLSSQDRLDLIEYLRSL